VRGRDNEALARTLDYKAASATSGDDTCYQHLANHGFLSDSGRGEHNAAPAVENRPAVSGNRSVPYRLRDAPAVERRVAIKLFGFDMTPLIFVA
jgi:hypothetical protein